MGNIDILEVPAPKHEKTVLESGKQKLNNGYMGIQNMKEDRGAEINEKAKEDSDKSKFTMSDVLVALPFICGSFCVGTYFSIIVPFFPQQAASKGMSSSLVGMVFASYQVALTVISPLVGNYLTQIGAKFAYVSGLGVTGVSCILFGVLDYSEGGTAYIVMCFITRLVEGVGLAGFMVSSVATMSNRFPTRASTMYSSQTACYGFGVSVGPAIGGVLYGFGGYILPFVVFGILSILAAGMAMWVLPATQNIHCRKKKGSILSLLKVPVVFIVSIVMFVSASASSLRNIGLSLWISDTFHMSPVTIAWLFFLHAVVFTVVVFFSGMLTDKFPGKSLLILTVGNLIGVGSLLFIGPAPFIPLPKTMPRDNNCDVMNGVELAHCLQYADNILWLFILCFMLYGASAGVKPVVHKVICTGAKEAGFTENLDLYGNVSGLVNLFYAAGNTFGPITAGYILDYTNLAWGGAFFGFGLLFCAMLTSVYMVVKYTCVSCHTKNMTTDNDTDLKDLLINDQQKHDYQTMESQN